MATIVLPAFRDIDDEEVKKGSEVPHPARLLAGNLIFALMLFGLLMLAIGAVKGCRG